MNYKKFTSISKSLTVFILVVMSMVFLGSVALASTKQMQIEEGTSFSDTQTKDGLTIVTTKTYQLDGVYINIRTYDSSGNIVRERDTVNPLKDHVLVVSRGSGTSVVTQVPTTTSKPQANVVTNTQVSDPTNQPTSVAPEQSEVIKQIEIVEGTRYIHTQTKDGLTIITTKTYQSDGVYISILVYSEAGTLIRERNVVNPIRPHIVIVSAGSVTDGSPVEVETHGRPANGVEGRPVKVATLEEFEDHEQIEVFIKDAFEESKSDPDEVIRRLVASQTSETHTEETVVQRFVRSIRSVFSSIFRFGR